MIKKLLLCGLIGFYSFTATGQTHKEKWIDSVFSTLSANEKLGQLFITRVSSHVQADILKAIKKRIASDHLGGVIFTSGSVMRQADITNAIQGEAEIQLLIGQDGSSGLGTLLDSALNFPIPLAQGAIRNDSLLYWMARETGRQMKALGVNLSLSPNANPINTETPNVDQMYGDDVLAVAEKALLHMKGLQDEGILSCARYFPLKGISVIDEKGKSHLKLYHEKEVSYPFQLLFAHGLNAVMPDVTDLPMFFEEKKPDLRKKVTDSTYQNFESGNLLHEPLDFKGMVIIDIQTMQSMTGKFQEGDAELFAFEAGADMIISDNELDPAFRKIKKLIRTEKQYDARLNQRIKKVLALKYDAGLSQKKLIDEEFLQREINTTYGQVLSRRLYEETVTTIQNQNNVVPVSLLEEKNFTCILAGDSVQGKLFYNTFKKYAPTGEVFLKEDGPARDLSDQHVITVAFFPASTEKMVQRVVDILDSLHSDQQLIVADFGCKLFKPYASRFPTVITGYDNSDEVVKIIPQVIFGALPSGGSLPLQYGEIVAGTGVETDVLNRLSYSFPGDAGIDGPTLERIEQIAAEAISTRATPGCHVLIAKEGKVIYDKSFGYLTYDNKIPVSDETLYDLASLTKVSATLQAVMFMVERGLIDINKKASVYLPELKGTSKKDITLVDMLTHQAGLVPFIPLWPLTVEGPTFLPQYYSSQRSVGYPLQISPTLFGSNILKDSVWSWIKSSKLLEKPMRTPFTYRYSDLGFMILKQLAEKTFSQPLDEFLEQNLYEPLGAYTMGYTPLNRFHPDRIAPTELDTLFRKGLVIGTVHDERAAMLGGISGHAGLFGTADDLSKLGQMLLQQGSYGGLRYYKPETVQLFTRKQFASSRRGLGWDKPVQSEWNSPTSIYASPRTFGHTGFTGTCLWVDPEFNLVYVFVSNRVFPDRNDKLIKTNIRSRIQDVIYEAIFNYCKTSHQAPFRVANDYSEQ
jgi:CubicO group peptidase (beta-lactamase class C family)/beta-glucosidase-like glycosyl hydrolase